MGSANYSGVSRRKESDCATFFLVILLGSTFTEEEIIDFIIILLSSKVLTQMQTIKHKLFSFIILYLPWKLSNWN